MKVKCINDAYSDVLIKDHIYNVINEDNDGYEIEINGAIRWFYKYQFSIINSAKEDKAKVGLDVLEIEQGIKFDKNKLQPTLLLDDMPFSINEILKVLKFGADKYEEGNWLKVKNGIKRYRNASDRHRLQSSLEEKDAESGLLHLAHEAVNTLMLLELKLREIDNADKKV